MAMHSSSKYVLQVCTVVVVTMSYSCVLEMQTTLHSSYVLRV